MIVFSRKLVAAALVCGSVSALILACGSDPESKFKDAPKPTGTFGSDSGFGEGGPGIDPSIYKNDPLPEYCGPDSGVPQVLVTGTAECPDDKNIEGCGCNTVGETKPCWSGFRKQRNLGVCKDGMTTCRPKDETGNVWGKCEGEVLPEVTGTGVKACSCFSVGEWKIANTAPCVWNAGDHYYAYSTQYIEGYDAAHPEKYRNGYCGTAIVDGVTYNDPVSAEGTDPSTPGIWSKDTLKVDCAGTFKLCFKIRAGDYNAPKSDDCTLGETCVDADYTQEGVVQALPDLKPWKGADNACAKKWESDTPENVSPGYGEMIVKGQTIRCDAIDNGEGQDFVFHRVQFCARTCRDPANANNPECKACQLAGTGNF